MIKLNNIAFRSAEWRFAVFSLYKRILRLHSTKLSPAQKAIGDAYVRQEFTLNKKANERQAYEFMKEWRSYCNEIEAQEVVVGRDMNPADVSEMDDEMKEQLLKLKEEAEVYLKSLQVEQNNVNDDPSVANNVPPIGMSMNNNFARIPKNSIDLDVEDLTDRHFKK